MSNVLHRPVLMLDKDWIAYDITDVEKAILKTLSDRSRFLDPTSSNLHNLDSWIEAWKHDQRLEKVPISNIIHCPNVNIVVPEIMVCKEYSSSKMRYKKHTGKIRYNKDYIYTRDKFQCCYCNKRKVRKDLNVDHVIPQGQGGITSWENCVLSCYTCNTKKANRTPEQAGMKMHYQPTVPHNLNKLPIHRISKKIDYSQIPESWKMFVCKNEFE